MGYDGNRCGRVVLGMGQSPILRLPNASPSIASLQAFDKDSKV